MSIDEIPNAALSPGFVKEIQNSEASLARAEVLQDLHSSGGAQSTGVLEQPIEIGGRTGPEPTRYGDWEKNGRCIDF